MYNFEISKESLYSCLRSDFLFSQFLYRAWWWSVGAETCSLPIVI